MFDHEKKENKKSSKNKIQSDVLGSYTGKPEDSCDKPEQDADDL